MENFIKRLGINSFHYEKAITNSVQIFEKGLNFEKVTFLIFFYIQYMMLSVEHE